MVFCSQTGLKNSHQICKSFTDFPQPPVCVCMYVDMLLGPSVVTLHPAMRQNLTRDSASFKGCHYFWINLWISWTAFFKTINMDRLATFCMRSKWIRLKLAPSVTFLRNFAESPKIIGNLPDFQAIDRRSRWRVSLYGSFLCTSFTLVPRLLRGSRSTTFQERRKSAIHRRHPQMPNF